MSECKFLTPSTTKINLDGDDWIEVRDELSVGELRAASAAILGQGPDGRPRPRQAPGYAQTVAFLVDWNLRGPNGKETDISTIAKREAALDAMRKPAYDAVEQAIESHIVARAAEAIAKKKTIVGLPKSEPIS